MAIIHCYFPTLIKIITFNRLIHERTIPHGIPHNGIIAETVTCNMKNALYLIILLLMLACKTEKSKADLNENLSEQKVDTIIDPIQYPAEFRFGLDSISKLIYTNMNLTDEKGTVWISIKIDSTGIIEKMEIIKSENEKLNSEALRLARLIPSEWRPAELGPKRRKISSEYNIPIRFDNAAKILYSD